jgi:hypothetical protein
MSELGHMTHPDATFMVQDEEEEKHHHRVTTTTSTNDLEETTDDLEETTTTILPLDFLTSPNSKGNEILVCGCG